MKFGLLVLSLTLSESAGKADFTRTLVSRRRVGSHCRQMYRGEVGGRRLRHAVQRMVDHSSHPRFCGPRHPALALASGNQLSAQRARLRLGDRTPSAAQQTVVVRSVLGSRYYIEFQLHRSRHAGHNTDVF